MSLYVRSSCSLIGLAALALCSPSLADVSLVTQPKLTTRAGSGAAAVGDFNGDGRADVAVGVQSPAGVMIFSGRAAGGFEPPKFIALDAGPSLLTSADLNGDGAPEIVALLRGSAKVSILARDPATGLMAETQKIPVASEPADLALADLTGDGLPEIITADPAANALSIAKNQAGKFPVTGEISSGGLRPVAIAVADLNADRRPEIAVVNAGSGKVTVLSGSGADWRMSDTLAIPASTTGAAITAADLDRDGDTDLIVASAKSSGVGVVTMYRNTRAGLIGAEAFASGGLMPTRIAAADLNGDLKPELVITNERSGHVTVLEGSAEGAVRFAAAQNLMTDPGTGQFAIADLTGDGAPEVVATDRGSDSVHIFAPAAPAAACGADFDGSGAVGVDDLTGFISKYLGGSPTADFNRDGATTVQDVFDFVAAWHTGCR